MLTNVSIKNFKSFKNGTIIDLKKTNYSILSDRNVAENDVLKGVLFVGANASGKSNVIKSIKLLLDLLFLENNISYGTLNCLFSEETEFLIEYCFDINGNEIKYLVKINQVKNMIYEKLELNKKLIIERMGLAGKSYFSDKEITYDENEIDKDTLLLRTIYFNTRFAGNEILKKWFKFMQNSVYFNAFNRDYKTYGKANLDLYGYLNENGDTSINDFLKINNFEHTIEYSKNDSFSIGVTKNEKNKIVFKRDGVDVPIPFEIESLGNKILLSLLPPLIWIIKNDGLFLIDEFSSGFHNDLEELFIKYFMKNSKKSQLIFVSHSTNLLSNSLLRPDQIYTVSFNKENGSQIKRVSDEKPRMAQNLEKMYLSGVFGGLPDYENDEDK